MVARRGSRVAVDVFGFDGTALLKQDRSGVHPLIELHRGYAGPGLAVGDRPLDRRGSAVLGKKRGMHVDRPARGAFENVRAQDLAIGHHHQYLGSQGDNPFRFESQPLRLEHRKPQSMGRVFDRGGPQGQAPALRPVRLAHHQGDFVTLLVKRLEGGHRELAGAEESNPQDPGSSQSFALARLRSLRTIRSRFRGLSRSTNSFPST